MPAVVAWLTLHFVIGLAGTWLARRYAMHRNLLDQPGERRSHAMATPRGGGISIVAALLLAAFVALYWAPSQITIVAPAMTGLLLVAAVGWVDDHRPLSPWFRLGVHAVAAGLLALAAHAAGGDAWVMVVAFLGSMALVNVWNFMDGIDGLAASQALLVAIVYATHAGEGPVLWLALALAGATAGFLPFNFPKARIFLGDVGSGSLGYAVAATFVGASLEQPPATVAWWWLTLPLAPFMIDAALTLSSRILRRERWWEAHVQHAYQYLARSVGRHWPVTLGYGVATASLGVLVTAGRSFPAPFTIAMIAAVWTAGGAIWMGLRRSHRIEHP